MADKLRNLLSRLTIVGFALFALTALAAAQPAFQKVERMDAIAREMVNSGELDTIDWVEVSAIFGIDADGDVVESYGYAYDRSGKPHAVAFLTDAVEREVKSYREWLREEHRGDFIKMLFQFNRESRRFNADFEYDNPRRWQVTPRNLETIVEELRPNLGSP
ncbi:hypothetical protein A6U86_30025 [Rhizobium sp. AC27/96]|uniref:hypothetical protein n=1 Tax=Rhizobium sp. AC27/96 TaxID=1841653 RepID=UPI000827F417|nr:hypothetical protein [Rhizobium sp. AC27/96]OCJ04554.1 hypothetical protein A6U86_30025 [Rhizobium sp. AC27/96]